VVPAGARCLSAVAGGEGRETQRGGEAIMSDAVGCEPEEGKTLRTRGASANAIRHHYDISSEFFALWLDSESMSYGCGFFEEGDDLERAQLRKIDHHVAAVRAAGAARVLDVGCGWGNTLGRLVRHHGVAHAVGLTLSPEQARWIERREDPRLEVRVESWVDHRPEQPYDAILSIEAIEHFVRPGMSSREKIDVYRAFFERCHGWLRPGGALSLQTTAYGDAGPEDLDPFIAQQIFPESDLPRLSELVTASDRLFEVVAIRNDRAQYARTLREWLARLRAQRSQAVALVGPETVARWEHYLRLCVYMFVVGGCHLYRLNFQRIDTRRNV
jgi:cyclopropane-fatty-acyl-phospholipid synthase